MILYLEETKRPSNTVRTKVIQQKTNILKINSILKMEIPIRIAIQMCVAKKKKNQCNKGYIRLDKNKNRL